MGREHQVYCHIDPAILGDMKVNAILMMTNHFQKSVLNSTLLMFEQSTCLISCYSDLFIISLYESIIELSMNKVSHFMNFVIMQSGANLPAWFVLAPLC